MSARAHPAPQPVSPNGAGRTFFTDESELRGADQEVFREVLRDAVAAMEDNDVPYAIIGGIAASGFGRPRWTHDIDLFVRPQDAERALQALGKRGFHTERTDTSWLFKALKQQVMVDLIFKSKGELYFDDAMIERCVTAEFQGQRVRLIPPEDLLVLKAVVHDEAGPRHWHDALSIIAASELSWDYLLQRAQRAPRRVLSLLLYAHSLDLQVPNRVIRRLFEQVYNS